MELGMNWLSGGELPGGRIGLTGNNVRPARSLSGGEDGPNTSPTWDPVVASVVLNTGGWDSSAGSAGRRVEQEVDPALDVASGPLGLTVREIHVLRLIGEGYSVSGIADSMSYSESTIKKALHGAMRHMGARNRTHAVAIALRAKVI
jgi:DNA-binding CsgD family transcriptional regulator